MKKIVFLLMLITNLAHSSPFIHGEPHPNPTVAYKWMDIALEVTAREVDRIGAKPTIISRTLSMVATAMFDAWSLYDEKAIPNYSPVEWRRPGSERTLENKNKAISWAASLVLLDLFPEDKKWIQEQMKANGVLSGLSPVSDSPEELASKAVANLLKVRHHDGANQLGDEVGSSGQPYSDYTFYTPLNTIEKVYYPDRWQQIVFTNGEKKFAPDFLTPHWFRVRPFGLKSSDMFRPGPPPKYGSVQLKREVEEVVRYNANLSDQNKAIVEFMRDGPRSTGQTGHWLRFAQDVSRRDNYNLDQDVKLFYVVSNTTFDAFICSWDAKRYWDSSRPWTLVRLYYQGRELQGWKGPGKGFGPIPVENWLPYSPANFITPPFPGYPSGHSTVSASAAEILKLFTGSDRFGFIEKRRPGVLTEPETVCKDDSCIVTLDLPTFSATAEMAGISRIMGGYHIQADNVVGLDMGRKVARHLWPKFKKQFGE